MIIDTHVHAFPALSHHTKRLPTAIRTGLDGMASMASRVAAIGRAVVPASPLGVERLARWRKQGPRHLLNWTEMGMGLALLPSVAMSGTIRGLVASMNRHGIDHSVVIAGEGAAPNDWVLEKARESGGKIIPVAHPPRFAADAPAASIEGALLALADAGARGFKIHHNLDGLPVDAAVYRAMFEVAAARGLIHYRAYRVFSRRRVQAPVAGDANNVRPTFPRISDGARLAHMNRDDPEAAWHAMAQHDQLWVDTSWQTTESVRRALDTVGPSRIVLGSDWPLLHKELQGESLQILERAATESEFDIVSGASAIALIGGLG